MTRATASRQPVAAPPLYMSEAQVAAMLGMTPADWKARAAVLAREGLPPVDPLMGGRYWPAVRRFLDARHGLVQPLDAPDGQETWT